MIGSPAATSVPEDGDQDDDCNENADHLTFGEVFLGNGVELLGDRRIANAQHFIR